jgi:hypothetical protein
MIVPFFLEIPVYRCAREEYHAETDRLLQKNLRYVRDPELRAKDEIWYRANVPCWDYTEIVGWIRLEAMRGKIVGELFWITAKRLRRGIPKLFRYKENVFEVRLTAEQTSEMIYRQVSQRIESLRTEEPFRRRHIDLRTFHAVGPYVNWQSLVSADRL